MAEKAPINFISKEDLCTYRQGFICGATKIAEWKDEQFAKEKQQFIEKACEWIQNKAPLYYQFGANGQLFFNHNDMINDFKKAMTNEERANEIARCDCPTHYAGFSICNTDKFQGKNYCAVKVAALKAMQWKDEQMKEALNNILIECDACFDEQTTNTLESIIKHQISLL